MTTLPIPVDEATVAAYHAASPQERERVVQLVGTLVRASLADRSRADRLEAFRRAADATGREAQANGWNDELDAALLRGEFDHDE